VAGMGFAMSNVLVVKTSRVLPQMKPEMRTAVIFGGAAIFGALASCFEPLPVIHAGEPVAQIVLLVLVLGLLLSSNNMLVQYGLARVPANRASIIMLFEIVVTALSSWLLAGETPGPREWAGGACIVLASLLSSWVHRAQDAKRLNRQDAPPAHESADASAIAHAQTSRIDEGRDAETTAANPEEAADQSESDAKDSAAPDASRRSGQNGSRAMV
jgi:hypothetical protein